MGGAKVRSRMKLKGYIEMEIQRLEDKAKLQQPRIMGWDENHIGYLRGKIDALKWVLTKE